MTDKEHFETDNHPSGGWGSLKTAGSILLQEHSLLRGTRIVMHQNKAEGFACISCSWAKPAHPHLVEACENGIKATAWEITSKRTPSAFFAQHTVGELLRWSDHDLEEQGRLTEPLRWDAATDKYVTVSWDEAFADIGARLKGFEPQSVVFYTSGRASLETAYMFQLMARLYGSNNLPDSSNMCHESTSVALPLTIGVPIGTVVLDDFEHTDCIFFFGQNVGTNSPRMLHQLQDARKRGIPIVTFNPLKERGLVSFADPSSIKQMLSNDETTISTQYHQVKVGGDIAAITGICKALIEADDDSILSGSVRIVDAEFIAEHTHGFDQFAQFVRDSPWNEIELESGLTRAALQAAADEYARASAVIGIYGMGLTQHRRGVQNVQMVSNLLLLRGNIGKPGAGICPVRGHSNVQGQRTVGITEKPELVPLDQLGEQYGFKPPREKGLNTVDTCKAVLEGKVNGFVGLGGNFIRAIPETRLMEAAWPSIALTVQIATKLNRAHLVHGKTAYLLPCLGRIEIDRQGGEPQAVTIEDSTGCMHGSRGVAEPAADSLLSEPAIVARMAKSTLPTNPLIDWDVWVGDYSRVRDAIEITYPEIFRNFNARMWTPGGFRRPVPASNRVWKTATGKANFIVPLSFDENPDMPEFGADVLRLMTMRSDDQFNTSIYTLNDRFRGVYGTRHVLLMHVDDISRLGFSEGDFLTASTVASDGIARSVPGLRATAYDIPNGCVAGYFPECNPLIPLWHHAEGSQVPAAKSIPIRLHRE